MNKRIRRALRTWTILELAVYGVCCVAVAAGVVVVLVAAYQGCTL